MAGSSAGFHHMYHCSLRILSYHRFGEQESDYPFSRTYKQFAHDLGTKDFDWISIDDGMKSIIKACEMMREKNFRAKLFISTALVGTAGYCDWDDIWKLSRYHDIENHSHEHVILTGLKDEEVLWNIATANALIKKAVGRQPGYFVPPWNTYDEVTRAIAQEQGLQLVHSRMDILNNSR
jgi:peptidoglycan/xylan/chitin deacetylase (PgdA/CDA1 family)